MKFERKVPRTSGELKDYLDKLHTNRSHIVSVKVNPFEAHIEIDLDGKANFFGYSDMAIPIKRGSIDAAEALIHRMLEGSMKGFAPSDADAQSLFDMIDQVQR